jgi:hypothetical protein
VLYSTNTFHLASLDLVKHLPLLILPQRLASIKSLEMVWDLQASVDSSTYEAMLDVVMSALPSLQKLHISIDHCLRMAPGIGDYVDRREQELLVPMDDMMRKKIGPKLQDCQIALPCRLYYALYDRARSAGARVQRSAPGSLHWEQFWRSVPVEQGGKSQNEGYWVRNGLDDMPFTCTLGTGMPGT